MYPALGGDLTKDEGLLSTVSGTPLEHKGRFLIDPEAIHFYLYLPEEMEKNLSMSDDFDWDPGLIFCGLQIGWNSK